jgi:hypothetical protein
LQQEAEGVVDMRILVYASPLGAVVDQLAKKSEFENRSQQEAEGSGQYTYVGLRISSWHKGLINWQKVQIWKQI